MPGHALTQAVCGRHSATSLGPGQEKPDKSQRGLGEIVYFQPPWTPSLLILPAAIPSSLTLTPVSYVPESNPATTLSPALVVVLPIRLTIPPRLRSGRPRQFSVMWQ